jgi:hypothetical protein
MTKMFCDGCGAEITRNYVSERLKSEKNGIKVEVIVAAGHKAIGTNSGHACADCVIAAVASYSGNWCQVSCGSTA